MREKKKLKNKNKLKNNEKLINNDIRPEAEEDEQHEDNEEDEQHGDEKDGKQHFDEEDGQQLITAEDLSHVQTMLIITMQKGITEQRINELDLFKDDNGVLRLRGRLENAPLPYDTRHPIWLQRDDYVTELFIIGAHKKVLHNVLHRVRETVTEMKTRFNVPKLRQKVKSLIHKCTICRRLEGTSYLYPEKSNLPKFRFAENPFSTVGIDYAGPFQIRNVYKETKMLDSTNHMLILSGSSPGYCEEL